MIRQVVPVGAFILLLLAGCKSQDIPGDWAERQATIDGDSEDWKGYMFTYFEEQNTAFGVRNDSTNLYLVFLSRDENSVRLLERQGLTLWFNTDQKKEKKSGIRYFGGNLSGRKPPTGMPGPQGVEPHREGARPGFFRQLSKDSLEIVTENSGSMIPANGTKGPAAAATYIEGVYIYEFSIPLHNADSTLYSLGSDAGKSLKLGIELGYISPSEKKQMKERFKEGPGGISVGGGGGFGGRGGGGRGGGPGMGGPRPSAGEEYWMNLTLAANPGSE